MQRKDLNILADYFQFYLMDAQARPAYLKDWTEADVESRVKVAPHIVVVCPARNTTVLVVIEAAALLAWVRPAPLKSGDMPLAAKAKQLSCVLRASKK